MSPRGTTSKVEFWKTETRSDRLQLTHGVPPKDFLRRAVPVRGRDAYQYVSRRYTVWSGWGSSMVPPISEGTDDTSDVSRLWLIGAYQLITVESNHDNFRPVRLLWLCKSILSSHHRLTSNPFLTLLFFNLGTELRVLVRTNPRLF